MSGEKTQHCFNCGEPLGVFRHYPGEREVCGKVECLREDRDAARAEYEEARWRAHEDDYGMYR